MMTDYEMFMHLFRETAVLEINERPASEYNPYGLTDGYIYVNVNADWETGITVYFTLDGRIVTTD